MAEVHRVMCVSSPYPYQSIPVAPDQSSASFPNWALIP